MRLVYVDDSGDTRMTVYALLEVAEDDWRACLQQWLDLRASMRDQFGIPVRYELHAINFLNGRGNPSSDIGWNRKKGERRNLGVMISQHLAEMPMRWRVLYADGTNREACYRAATRSLEADLARAGEYATVMVDGDGSEPAYWRTHRDMPLASRRILEDPWQQGAHLSQWLMMADWVAYLAFQSLRGENELLRGWYQRYLASRDVHRGPVRS